MLSISFKVFINCIEIFLSINPPNSQLLTANYSEMIENVVLGEGEERLKNGLSYYSFELFEEVDFRDSFKS